MVGVARAVAPRKAGCGDASAGRLVAGIEPHLVQKLVVGAKEVGFEPFLEESLVLVGSVGEEEATAGRDFERPRGVLVGTDGPEEAQPDAGPREGAGVVVAIDFTALERPGESGPLRDLVWIGSGELAEDDVAAERPAPVAEVVPVASPHLEVRAGLGDSAEQVLAAWLPAAEKADGAGPPRVGRGERPVDVLGEAERHVNRLRAGTLIVGLLVAFAVDEGVEERECRVHDRRPLPREREVRVRREVDEPGTRCAEGVQCLRSQVFLLLGPNEVWAMHARGLDHAPVDRVHDRPATAAALHLPGEPSRLTPRLNGVNAAYVVPEPLEGVHPHQ